MNDFRQYWIIKNEKDNYMFLNENSSPKFAKFSDLTAIYSTKQKAIKFIISRNLKDCEAKLIEINLDPYV